MKNITLLTCLLMTSNLFGQQPDEFRDERKIKVSGRASMEIEPTSYVVGLTIQEIVQEAYNVNEKPKIKTSIDTLVKGLQEAVKELGYSKNKMELISTGASGYNSRSSLIIVSETFEITIKDFKDVERFIKLLKTEGLTILKVKRIFDIDKKETEINLYQSALQDAKDKATKLLATVNKTIGDILSIDLYSNHSQPMIDDDSNYSINYSGVETLRKKLVWATYAVTFQIK